MAHHPSVLGVQAHRTNLLGAAAVPTHGEGIGGRFFVFGAGFGAVFGEQLGRVCKIWLQNLQLGVVIDIAFGATKPQDVLIVLDIPRAVRMSNTCARRGWAMVGSRSLGPGF